MKELILPLVDSLVAAYNGPGFSKVKIIGAQHILETTHAMFRSLYRLGLQPENVSLIGKCYSTCKEVYDEMVDDGIDISSSSFEYSSYKPFDEQYSNEVRNFLQSHLNDLSSGKYDQIIVLDDGGKCIDFLSKYSDNHPPIIAIEQTTAGYDAIRNIRLKFPVINVARSPVKLELESPMIAQAAAERLYVSLQQRNLFPERALLIGGGAIGQAMKNRLSSDMKVTIYDQNKQLSDCSFFHLEQAIKCFPLIIGCTGKTTISHTLHSQISKGTILVSVSSSDREFDSVHLRKQIIENDVCHQDLSINDVLLVNSGFPVNFDGARENIKPELIQLTIALITGGILQARSLPTSTSSEIIPVFSSIEKKIVNEFLGPIHNPNIHLRTA